jgi:hypothetical protein
MGWSCSAKNKRILKNHFFNGNGIIVDKPKVLFPLSFNFQISYFVRSASILIFIWKKIYLPMEAIYGII